MGAVRGSGVLLHPTSLPGPRGTGEAGAQAHRFVRWLADARQSLWQVLPLGPPGYGDSPYAALSAFAGDARLVDGDELAAQGWVARGELRTGRTQDLLELAADRFLARGPGAQRAAFDAFCGASAPWLDDFALFMALHRRFEGRTWTDWDRPLALRDPTALAEARGALRREIDRHRFAQWRLREDWARLKRAANGAGIRLLGDMPMFVAHQSADAWAHRDLFHLDDAGRPRVVAGVPPDYFSRTGQRWGNPLYRWDAMAAQGWTWWTDRFRAVLDLVDLVRIDHFRGFAANWEIPADHPTAEHGRWAPGPGAAFFEAMRDRLGALPIVAEDLGVITPDVVALRDRFGLPGMRVLQFAFGSGPDNPYLPHNHVPRGIVYTGTHDNDSTRGWFASMPPAERAAVLRYTGTDGSAIERDLMRLASMSVSEWCVFPIQDVLGLGTEARMNRPGASGGNWNWRLRDGQPGDGAARWLAELTQEYGREPAASRT